MDSRRVICLLAVSAGSLAGLVLVTRRAGRGPRAEDREVRRGLRRVTRSRAGRVAEKVAGAVGPVGKAYVHLPATGLAALIVARHDRDAALTLLGADVAATVASRVVEKVAPQRRGPPGKPPDQQTYPSNHAFELVAVGSTGAYLLGREHPVAAVAVAVLPPLVGSLSRLLQDRHWISDVAGGVLGGLGVAAAAAAVYEIIR